MKQPKRLNGIGMVSSLVAEGGAQLLADLDKIEIVALERAEFMQDIIGLLCVTAWCAFNLRGIYPAFRNGRSIFQ